MSGLATRGLVINGWLVADVATTWLRPLVGLYGVIIIGLPAPIYLYIILPRLNVSPMFIYEPPFIFIWLIEFLVIIATIFPFSSVTYNCWFASNGGEIYVPLVLGNMLNGKDCVLSVLEILVDIFDSDESILLYGVVVIINIGVLSTKFKFGFLLLK